MATTKNVDDLIARLRETTSKFAPNSPELKKAFHNIGMRIVGETRSNIFRQKLWDTGNLVNSVAYEFYSDTTGNGLRAGSYNVPYAAVHEFGFSGSVNVPSHTRTMSKVFGRKLEHPIQVKIKAHHRRMNIRARPYLRPAFRSTETFIIDTLRQALQNKQ